MRSLLAVAAMLPLLAGCSVSSVHDRAAAPTRSTPRAPAASVSAPAPPSTSVPTLTATASSRASGLIPVNPTEVTLEQALPASTGSQRETVQTFTLTGELKQKIVEDLRTAPLDTGPAAAGCQPSMPTTTIHVGSAAMRRTFVAYCEDVSMVAPNAPVRLRFTHSLQTHIDEVLANLSLTGTVDPPTDSSLLIELFTPTNTADTAQKSIAGTVTVTQDGLEIGSKHLASGRSWTLPLRQGAYTITADAAGYRCNTPQTITVHGHEQIGPSLSCKRN